MSGGEETTGYMGDPGEFVLLTYNVAGLPQGLSSSDPEAHMPQISPKLNGYDIVVVQEDFWYHPQLSAEAEHAYVSEPYTDMPELTDIGDGLNRFSRYPFEMFSRTPWWSCEGTTDCASDCLATKGFSVARHTLDGNITVDIYNLHNEAGSCPRDEEIRDKAADDLIAEIAMRSEGKAVIVAGDFNLHEEDAVDLEVYTRIADQAGLQDACWVLDCGSTSIDRVLFRGAQGLSLEVTQWSQPSEFIDTEDDGPLSDHDPTAVRFSYAPE